MMHEVIIITYRVIASESDQSYGRIILQAAVPLFL